MGTGRRILIVEDEAMIAFLLEEMVQDLGYEVASVANSLDDAMTTEPGAFDLAILDVQLGGREVFPFAETLTAHGTPFAFATGNGAGRIPSHLRGVPLLEKPFQQESLKRVLDALTPP